MAEPIATAATLPLPTLIQCLEERIAIIRDVGEGPIPIEIGGLADLIEQAVKQLRRIDGHVVRILVETRRDYGEA